MCYQFVEKFVKTKIYFNNGVGAQKADARPCQFTLSIYVYFCPIFPFILSAWGIYALLNLLNLLGNISLRIVTSVAWFLACTCSLQIFLAFFEAMFVFVRSEFAAANELVEKRSWLVLDAVRLGWRRDGRNGGFGVSLNPNQPPLVGWIHGEMLSELHPYKMLQRPSSLYGVQLGLIQERSICCWRPWFVYWGYVQLTSPFHSAPKQPIRNSKMGTVKTRGQRGPSLHPLPLQKKHSPVLYFWGRQGAPLFSVFSLRTGHKMYIIILWFPSNSIANFCKI